jgi:hypothetical protein
MELQTGFYKCVLNNCDTIWFFDGVECKKHGDKDKCWEEIEENELKLGVEKGVFIFEKDLTTCYNKCKRGKSKKLE